jgi:hypothetical protein
MLRGEIAHRRRHHADVDDVCAAGTNALRKRGCKLGTGKPAIAADDERVTPALECKRAERLPDARTTGAVSVAPTTPRMSYALKISPAICMEDEREVLVDPAGIAPGPCSTARNRAVRADGRATAALSLLTEELYQSRRQPIQIAGKR